MKEMYEKIDIQKEAIKNVEEEGIIFIDEIDKLAVAETSFQNGKGVST
jgi:ATP-dependent protease HslVU (ClpYQ) ATPase subunit